MRLALVLAVAAFFPLTLAPGAGVAAAQESRSLTTDQVVVEKILVAGDNASSASQKVLEDALDLELGAPMSRDQLDESLTRARQRLEALAYYQSIDIGLRKGSVRNHFEIVAALTPANPLYSGASYSRLHIAELGGVPIADGDLNLYEAFAGTRDLFKTGSRFEMNLSHFEYSFGGEDDTWSSQSETNAIRVTAYQDSIFGSQYFFGVSGSYEQSKSRSSSSYQDETFYDKTIDVEKLWRVAVGRRFGLLSVAGGMDRRFAESYDEDWNSTSTETTSRATLQYTDKSGLASVEQGATAKMTYERPTAPVREYHEPNLTTELSYTVFFAGNQAFTPKGILLHDWSEDFNYSAGEERQRKVGLQRFYDLSLLYQYVFPHDLVLSLKGGFSDDIGTSENHQQDFMRRYQLGLSYSTPSLIFDLRFIYGLPGLEWQEDDLLSAEPARMKQ
jgi:hypothetical protein